jgi:hypothetical protein
MFVLYVWSCLCVGMMRTELGLDVELRGVFWVSSCDVSQSVNRVKVVDPLFPDQYNLLEDVFEEWLPEIHFHSSVACF